MKPLFYTMLFAMSMAYQGSAQSPCSADSLALVDLYKATNGANWKNHPNWLTANPLNTWYGVSTSAQGCVTQLVLDTNRLTGSIPTSFKQLNNLRLFSFAFNKVDSLPDLSTLQLLGSIFASNNTLTFDDLVPNIKAVSSYAPQDSIFKDATYSKYVGQTLTIDLGVDAAVTSNVYNWYKDSFFYTTTFTNQLTFNALQVSDAGVYTCRVTNKNIPFLTLYSRKATVIVNACFQRDSLALAALYTATNGANWTNKTNWLSTSPSNWYGVTTNIDGCVTALSLPNNQLSGALPANFGDFPYLTTLTLNNNRLTGNIPIKLCNSPNLSNLYLFKNQLTGSLPDSLGQLTQLRQFDVSENQLTGNIPTSMGNLTNLQFAYLDSNQLTGAIPASFNNLTQLWRFSAFKNRLDSLPNLSALTQLVAFTVAENKLTFDDIVPNVARGLIYANQAKISNDSTYKRFAGDGLTMEIPIDKALTSNVYSWYKDGRLYRITNVNKLVFNTLQTFDAGVYTCEVTNPNAPNLTLYSGKFTLIITAITKNLNIQLCQGDSHRLPKGRWVQTNGIYPDTLRSWLNTDSIILTNVQVNPRYKINLPVQIVCNARDTMTVVQHFKSNAGCDSTVIQAFRLAKSDKTDFERFVCDTLLEGVDTIRLKNQNGCDSLVLQRGLFDNCICLQQTRVYNGLIPNDSDNKNNVFIIDYIERYTPNELAITDKRGMLVFKTQNYKNDWTGTNQHGAPLPEGMYNFVFRTTHPITNQACLRMGTIGIKYIP